MNTMTGMTAGPRPPILSLLNRRIVVSDGFAGQSFTLVEMGDEYLVLREFFGSGLPVVGSVTYRLSCNNGRQIRFSELLFSEDRSFLLPHPEQFILRTADDGAPELLLNGLRVLISRIE